MKILVAVLLVLLLFLQYKLWFDTGSVPDMMHLKETLNRQMLKNIQLQKHNEALEAEVKQLKHGKQAIEERARNDLGMVKEGERYYRFVKR